MDTCIGLKKKYPCREFWFNVVERGRVVLLDESVDNYIVWVDRDDVKMEPGPQILF